MKKKEKFKKKILGVFFWLVLIVSFLFFAGVVHLKANGWQFNYRTFGLVKTGMIALNGQPGNAQIKINNKVLNKNLPIKIRNLIPGNYEVELSLSGYQSWQKTIQVLPGRVSSFEKVILFFENPSSIEVPANITETIIKEGTRQSEQLEFAGPEIYFNKVLVTRFSQDILTAAVYPEGEHLIVQLGNEIRVIDLDGSNDRLLFRLESFEPSIFIFRDNAKNIYYLDSGKILGKNIR